MKGPLLDTRFKVNHETFKNSSTAISFSKVIHAKCKDLSKIKKKLQPPTTQTGAKITGSFCNTISQMDYCY